MDPVVAALIGLITGGVGAVFTALVRGDVVMGWMYRQERKDRLKAEAALDKLIRATNKLPVKPPDDSGGG